MTKQAKAPRATKNISPGVAPGTLKKRTISQLADAHQKLDDKIDVLKDKIKEHEGEQEKIALEAKSRLQSDGQVKGSTPRVDFELKERDHYNIKDFDALWKWCVSTKRFIFHRRIGTEAYRDLMDANIRVPGVVKFTEKVFTTKRRKTRA